MPERAVQVCYAMLREFRPSAALALSRHDSVRRMLREFLFRFLFLFR